MKPTALNRWLKPFAILLVIILIVMVLIPAELTDEQLARIEPGMTIAEVYSRIGKSNVREGWSVYSFGATEYSGGEEPFLWHQSEKWLAPDVKARLLGNSIKLNTTHRKELWLGRTRLLWVEHDQDKVLKVWLIPVTKNGGGLQGIINTLVEYWDKWQK